MTNSLIQFGLPQSGRRSLFRWVLLGISDVYTGSTARLQILRSGLDDRSFNEDSFTFGASDLDDPVIGDSDVIDAKNSTDSPKRIIKLMRRIPFLVLQ